MTAAAGVELHGHRGARGLLPENSIVGFREAIRLGVDCIETDIGMSRDGALVIHHDRALNPDLARRDGQWIDAPVLLRALTAKELAVYDIGHIKPGTKYARKFAAQRPIDDTSIPLLRDLLAMPELASVPKVCLNLEIKTSPLAPDETETPERIATALVALVDKAGFRTRVRIQSFDWRNLIHLRRIAPDIPLGFLTAEEPWLDNLERGRRGASPWLGGADLDAFDGSVPRLVRHLGGAYWAPYHRRITDADVAAAHAEGLRVMAWTVNDGADMRRLLEAGVDGLITDFPDIGRREIDAFLKTR